jgi:acyl carrier protein
MQPVPAGVSGELYLGGPTLARGYLARPDLTAERFVPHPFTSMPGQRLYRTGDLVRCRSDGNLEYLGRLDTQVKVRGFRIEALEVEAMLQRHASIDQAVVVAREDPVIGTCLVAYLIACDGRPSARELRQFLQDRLPAYMIPAAYVFVDTFPLSGSGKIDRDALPPPEESDRGTARRLVAPRSPLEKRLAGLWADVLGVGEVGIHEHFFADLGGHSLLAARLISRVRDGFGVELPLREIFESPTVAALALAIVRARAAHMADDALARTLAEVEELSDVDVQGIIGGHQHRASLRK